MSEMTRLFTLRPTNLAIYKGGEENRHVSYLENSQDRDQALLVDEDRIES